MGTENGSASPVRIPVGKHHFATVDADDLEMLSQYRWTPKVCKHTTYALTTNYGGKPMGIRMHRLILGLTDPGILCDHRDRNGLNNCRSNLRVANKSINASNNASWAREAARIKQGLYGDQFRQRVRAERERRGWTQAQVAAMLEQRGVLGTIATTIAKLEAGNRAVRVDELAALADVFGISVDALIGRNSAGSDLVWAISKLTSAAQKAVNDVGGISQRIAGELQDVRHYAQFDSHSVDNLIHTSITACNMLNAARNSLQDLANQFPLGGRG